jgi:hypothetical protein
MIGSRRRDRGGIELAAEEPNTTVLIGSSEPKEARSTIKRRIALRRRPLGSRSLSDRFAFLRADSPVPIYIGIVVVLAGFALIGLTWGKVAGLLQVALQLPYLVSGGLTGLGLIVVGVTVISISAKRRDAAEQGRQLEQLAGIMKELQATLRDGEVER